MRSSSDRCNVTGTKIIRYFRFLPIFQFNVIRRFSCLLLQAVKSLQTRGYRMSFKFLKYAQSSQCFNMADSSVSYASGSLIFEWKYLNLIVRYTRCNSQSFDSNFEQNNFDQLLLFNYNLFPTTLRIFDVYGLFIKYFCGFINRNFRLFKILRKKNISNFFMKIYESFKMLTDFQYKKVNKISQMKFLFHFHIVL